MTSLVTLEGLHALKHALRFGADVVEILSDDPGKALAVADTVAPELREVVETRVKAVSRTEFRERASQPVPTHLLAYAVRPTWTLAQALPSADHPTVLLDDPRNSKNLGAVIRVAAAVEAAGVLVNGPIDPFDIMSVRGAAGLQWAVPCYASPDLLAELDAARAGSTLVGLDADGQRFHPGLATTPTIFAFGSERTGLSDEVRASCDQIVSLPMRPGVSSLNLATCVSAVMYLRMYSGQ